MKRRYIVSWYGLALMLWLGVTVSPNSSAATLRVLAQMPGTYEEPGPITEGSPGLYFFLAADKIGSINKAGALTTITQFQDPPYILESAPTSAANGRLYSSVETTAGAGSGYVFSVASSPGNQTYGALSVAPTFTQNLPDGNLLALAYQFSDASYGLAEATLNGTVMAPIYVFPNSDQTDLDALYATDGNYYGSATTADKKSSYVYQITPSGNLTKILTFPVAHATYVLQASDGNLYGATAYASKSYPATLFKLTLSGQYTLLHTFPTGAQYSVNMLIEGSDGKIYGATKGTGGGTGSRIFSITTSGQYQDVYNLASQQGQCTCSLVQGSDGLIYGTALEYGTTGGGTIFALDAGLPIPAPNARAFSPASGAPGSKVRIWGANLFGAKVQFNGVAANKASNSGPNYVWVTVPEGALSGPITVTTPGGASTTAASFTVE